MDKGEYEDEDEKDNNDDNNKDSNHNKQLHEAYFGWVVSFMQYLWIKVSPSTIFFWPTTYLY